MYVLRNLYVIEYEENTWLQMSKKQLIIIPKKNKYKNHKYVTIYSKLLNLDVFLSHERACEKSHTNAIFHFANANFYIIFSKEDSKKTFLNYICSFRKCVYICIYIYFSFSECYLIPDQQKCTQLTFSVSNILLLFKVSM